VGFGATLFYPSRGSGRPQKSILKALISIFLCRLTFILRIICNFRHGISAFYNELRSYWHSLGGNRVLDGDRARLFLHAWLFERLRKFAGSCPPQSTRNTPYLRKVAIAIHLIDLKLPCFSCVCSYHEWRGFHFVFASQNATIDIDGKKFFGFRQIESKSSASKS